MSETRTVPGATRELSDEEVVRRVVAGDGASFEILMRRHNQGVYRIARSILADDALAQDLAQDAWVRVYERLRQFAGEARFSTWLTKIVVHEAWARSRRSKTDSARSPRK
jgi:RNA polymerase sigma-70 factor, ECF subfamily